MSEESWALPGYRIGRVLGRGGFATVYEAEQLSLRRTVALKVLSVDLAAESDRRRFDRERHVLARLSEHPYVVDVHDAGVSGGRPYIVMRLYGRGTLAQLLRASGPLAPAYAVSTATKLASALDAAHTMHILHRDVKPENVLLADSDEPVLTDFGIAAIVDPDERATKGHHSTNFFTMAHVAPEVLDGGRYSVASDVYALASTIYMLLAGRPAFDPANPRVTSLILDSPAPPVGRPDVPAAMDAVLRQGLSKDPAARHPSAGALASALAAASPDGAPTAWAPPGYPPAFPTQVVPPALPTQVVPPDDGTTRRSATRFAALTRRPLRLVAAGTVTVLALAGASWLSGWPLGGGGCQAPRFSDSEGTALPTPTTTALGGAATATAAAGVRTIYGPASDITAVTFSCDGAVLATGSSDDTARLWSVSSGRLLRTFTPGAGDVTSVRFSRDGRTLATGDAQGSVRLWDVESSASLKVFSAPAARSTAQAVHSVDLSPDGATVAAGYSDGVLRVWAVADGKEQAQVLASSDDVNVVRFSPDGQTLATGADDGSVVRWRAADATKVSSIAERVLGGTSGIDDLAFSGDGTQLAVANGSARVIELATGSARQVLPRTTYGVSSLAFSADGGTLVTGGLGGLVTVWDVVTGVPRSKPYRDHAFQVSAIDLSPDGTQVVSVGDARIVLRRLA